MVKEAFKRDHSVRANLRPVASVPLQLPQRCLGRDDFGHRVLQLPEVVREGELLRDCLLSRNPSTASLSVLEGPLSTSAPIHHLLSSLASLPVPAPGPDACPISPYCFQGPCACLSAIDPNSHLNLFARPPSRKVCSAKGGLAAASPDGLNKYKEGIADTLLLILIRGFEASDFLV